MLPVTPAFCKGSKLREEKQPRVHEWTADVAVVESGGADEIDQVLSHSRHEDRLSDSKDIPQENLVRLLSPVPYLSSSP